MIKLTFCLRRLPGLTVEAFSAYWRNDHARLVQAHAATLRIRRYVQSHAMGMDDPRLVPALDARGAQLAPFDGVAELWWDSVEDILEVGATSEGRQAGRSLLLDERCFIDLQNSPIFYTVEHEIISMSATGQ